MFLVSARPGTYCINDVSSTVALVDSPLLVIILREPMEQGLLTMKSTLKRLKDCVFKGDTRIPWAELLTDEYRRRVGGEDPNLARQLDKLPYAKFQQ